MTALHRYEDGDHNPIFVVADGETVRTLKGAHIPKWIKSLVPGSTLRVTAGHSADGAILDISERGVLVTLAHWHSTGLDKNLPPEEIAKQYAALPENLFRPLVARPDIAKLRYHVSMRLALMDYRKRAANRIAAVSVWCGGNKEIVADSKAELEANKKEFEGEKEKEITALAKKIPECVLFNEIAGVKGSYFTAACVVAFLGDMSRFPRPSSLWHYCGLHVVDGKAPKRAKGKVADWNPRVRTALWQWADSMLKTGNPKWRPLYDRYRAEELAVHHLKCETCGDKVSSAGFQLKDSHSGARARRRVMKELMLEFFLAAKERTSSSVDTLKGLSAVA